MADFPKTPIDPAVTEDVEGNDVMHLAFCEGRYDNLTYSTVSGKFYFWDETLANLVGPYDTQEEGDEAYQRYYEYITWSI